MGAEDPTGMDDNKKQRHQQERREQQQQISQLRCGMTKQKRQRQR
jgi:hypothetical protein